jgi:hypothetical protein
MAQIKIRKVGPKRWQVTRPAYGFATGDKVTVHASQRAAVRSLPGRDVGTPGLITHTSDGLADGIAPVPPWSPLEYEPAAHRPIPGLATE